MKFKLIVLILIALSSLSSCQTKKQDAAGKEAPSGNPQPAVNELPDLNVTDVNGTPIQLRDLSGEIALIFFNPDCDHCQHQADMIVSQKNLFKNQQLYFVTAESIQAITKFISDHKLNEPNFHFSNANPAEVYRSVGNFTSMPTIFVYKDKKKLAKFEGTTPVGDIANVFTVK